MYEIGINELRHLLENGQKAVQYTWDNYEELAAREHSHTLYGPYAYEIGACIPSKMTPDIARKLLPSTRRRNHLIYELDGEHKVIRTISVRDYTKVECIYHHFDLDGVSYAYPFRGDKKVMYTDAICMLKFINRKPVYYGVVRKSFLFIQFYEYIDTERMIVSTYRYNPDAQLTRYGYPIDPDAPIGALNSCVDRHCREEPTKYIDFSHWFQ